MQDHTYKLYAEEKLKANDAFEYYFEIEGKTGTYKGYLFSGYFNDKLYSLSLVFKDEPYSLTVLATLSDLYDSKYGNYDWINKPLKDVNLYEKYWIRGNLKIKAVAGEIADASISYIDLRVEKQKLAADSLEKKNKEDELKKKI
jgi:hypothetical protein